MRRLIALLAAAVVGGLLATGAAADGHFRDDGFDAVLSGDEEVSAVTTEGSGYVAVEISADGTTLDYRLYADGLDDATVAHIHVGGPGENGPPVVFLFGPEDPPVMADGSLAEGTLTEGDLQAVDGVFDGTMQQLVEMIRAGETYVNVHTATYPAGEIRGQLAPAAFDFHAPLAGSNEVPPVATSASGVAALSLDSSQAALGFGLATHGLEDITMAHIHVGRPGENGPPVVFLFGPGDGVTRDGILSEGTITEADLVTVPDVFDGTMKTLVDLLRAGSAYVNVHTVANAAGEIRGQVEGVDRVTGGETFTDDDSSLHEGNIEVIAAVGITRGCNPPANDEFCPSDVFTRGQGAAFFNRAFNLVASADDAFDDDTGSTFEANINAIAARDITRGCNPPDNDRFCPDDPITRAQWASLMVRALGLTEGGDTDRFTDDDGSVHEEDINRIAAAGITVGCNPPDNDEFCPNDTVTREQAASFFVRALGWGSVDS